MPAGTPNCSSSDVGHVSATLQGGAGSAVGEVRLANTGATTCLLRGAPLVRLYTAGGQMLPVRNIGQTAQSARRLLVHPGETAVSHIAWGNGCHLSGNADTIEIDWPGGSATTHVGGTDMPRCDAPSVKSHVTSSRFTTA